ncbi:DUF1573 domain-containing protein [Empedobacter falsenii]|uniref:DUF1573 domain-containing protein n=1 Tax=Empedobacter falsenii TaxID=343874 RepID=UPI0025753659|nr:DUF1573 domain-containing protein [Empedobacter falsenii]MDM1548362.1 DUF1573 domain-containing protein [Empedobacter falsenii]
MHKVIFVLIFFFYNIFTFGQLGPKIKFLAEDNTIDYGFVVKGRDDGFRFFEFINTGDQPLIIKNVESTCGCLIAFKPTEVILPGKKNKIKVKYNMTVGRISKILTVNTNAANYENGIVKLKIKGEVIEQ